MKSTNLLNTQLIKKNTTIVVAVSGGPDSTALLYLLDKVKKRFNLKLYVAHYNHGLRGKQSDGDEAFVKKLADKIGLECIFEKTNNAKKVKGEKQARDERYSFLIKTACKVKSSYIALAHNSDDNVETILFRVLKGSGPSGLSGIREKRKVSAGEFGVKNAHLEKQGVVLIRPLLKTEKKSILKYLKDIRIKYRTDATNKTDMYDRNKIRNTLIPYLEKNINKGLKTAIAGTGFIASADNDYMELQAAKTLERICSSKDKKKYVLDRTKFLKLHDALRLRVVFGVLKSIMCHHRKITLKLVVSIIESIEQGTNMDLPENKSVAVFGAEIIISECDVHHRTKRVMHVIFKEKKEVGLKKDKKVIVFENKKYEMKVIKNTKSLNLKDPNTGYFDFEKIIFPVTIRNRKPGDVFHPFGMRNTVKLKGFLNSNKAGGQAVIFQDKNGIFWVEGIRTSEQYKVEKGSKSILRLRKI